LREGCGLKRWDFMKGKNPLTKGKDFGKGWTGEGKQEKWEGGSERLWGAV